MSDLADRAIPNLDAPILPGRSSGGIELGSKITETLAGVGANKIRRLKEQTVLKFESVSVWLKDGVVTQVGVHEGYRGSLDHTIKIGSTLAEVSQRFHCGIVEDEEDNLIAEGVPGCSFETDEWVEEELEKNMGARITWIFVHPM